MLMDLNVEPSSRVVASSSSSNNSLLPLEQTIPPSNNEHTESQNTRNILNSSEHEIDFSITMESEEEFLSKFENNNKELPFTLTDLDFESDANLNIQSQEMINHLSSTSKSQKKLKRPAYKLNPRYITNNLNQSLFNESPVTKQARTPMFNSPSSSSRQSPIETRAPSPLPIPQQYEYNTNNLTTMEANELQTSSSGTFDVRRSNSTNINVNDLNEPNHLENLRETSINVEIIDNTHINNYDIDHQSTQCNITIPSTSTSMLNVEQKRQSINIDGSNENSRNIENSIEELNELPTLTNTRNEAVYVLTNDETNASRLTPMDLDIHNEGEARGREFEETNVDFDDDDVEDYLEMLDDGMEILNKNTQEKLSRKNVAGIYESKLAPKGWVVNVDGPFESTESQVMKVGTYATFDIASRIEDLVAFKLNKHTNLVNFIPKFPISDYQEELEEMKKWSEEDYIWSLKRQSLEFASTKSGFKGVYRKSPGVGKVWEGKLRIANKKNVSFGSYEKKEIPAIFWDLMVVSLKKKGITTNFRPGHYTQEDANNFKELLENKKQIEACEWDLIKRILAEPPFFSKYIIHKNTVIQSSNIPTSSRSHISEELPLLASTLPLSTVVENNPHEQIWHKMHPREMAEHFMNCSWEDLETSWKSLRKPTDDCDLMFERGLIESYGALIWSPYDLKLINVESGEKFKYKYFFPCVIATSSCHINIQRRIFGFIIHQDIANPLDNSIKNLQRQWISLPSIRYLPPEFEQIIACDSGLLVLKGGKQPQNLSTRTNQMDELLASYDHCWILKEFIEVKNQSIIIITNPLTYEMKSLPPIPHKILNQKVAQFNFDDSTKTTYHLIVVGVHQKPIPQGHQALEPIELGLGIYSSITNSWIHFDCIEDAGPLPQILGSSTVVVHGSFVYCGGVIIDSKSRKRPFLRPSIFYFNISNARKQHVTTDFSKGGDPYFVTHVEPPRLVKIGNSPKLYAISREVKACPNVLFIIEVLVGKDGVPTGFYKASSHGRMPEDIFEILFRRPCNYEGDKSKKKRQDENNLPWEATARDGYIAIKVIGLDPAIALYDVKKDEWKYTCFPYTEPKEKPSDSKAWKLILGAYEPRWNAIP